VPAGGGFVAAALGRLGHQPAGIMTGMRGARCNRGGRRRDTPAILGARSAKPGPGCTLGCVSPKDRAVVERRQASAPCRVRACRKASGCGQRLSAFCFLVCFASAPRPIVMLRRFHCRGIRRRSGSAASFLAMACRIARVRIASRERERFCLPPTMEPGGADS
jgi:hypothetical protein